MAKPALDLIGKGSPQHQSSVSGGGANVSAGQIDTAAIAKLVGHEGEQNGQVYRSQSAATTSTSKRWARPSRPNGP